MSIQPLKFKNPITIRISNPKKTKTRQIRTTSNHTPSNLELARLFLGSDIGLKFTLDDKIEKIVKNELIRIGIHEDEAVSIVQNLDDSTLNEMIL
ncbi:MAG: hypothetical protein NT066_08035 [Candidatus Omnitrophica bacterium]|nr:hypothetical protein [Candidatus Omnitrophota bacterium]